MPVSYLSGYVYPSANESRYTNNLSGASAGLGIAVRFTVIQITSLIVTSLV
jgi:hypothetical protein